MRIYFTFFVLSMTFLTPKTHGMEPSGTTFYAIGNSLTWDALAGSTLGNLFAKGGEDVAYDYHIRCGSSLTYTKNNPHDPCVTPKAGTWDVALLSNDYDLLILQPHEGGSTTQSEINAMTHFASLNDAPVVIYEAYPDRNAAADLSGFYLQPDQTLFHQTAAEFNEIEQAFPNATTIPAMEVLIELDENARNGFVPGINTAQDLYRDARHLNGIGRYALGLTFFSSITGQDPSLTGLNFHPTYAGLSMEQALAIQDTVREVVLAPVPLPASFILFISGILGLSSFTKRKTFLHSLSSMRKIAR